MFFNHYFMILPRKITSRPSEVSVILTLRRWTLFACPFFYVECVQLVRIRFQDGDGSSFQTILSYCTSKKADLKNVSNPCWKQIWIFEMF